MLTSLDISTAQSDGQLSTSYNVRNTYLLRHYKVRTDQQLRHLPSETLVNQGQISSSPQAEMSETLTL